MIAGSPQPHVVSARGRQVAQVFQRLVQAITPDSVSVRSRIAQQYPPRIRYYLPSAPCDGSRPNSSSQTLRSTIRVSTRAKKRPALLNCSGPKPLSARPVLPGIEILAPLPAGTLFILALRRSIFILPLIPQFSEDGKKNNEIYQKILASCPTGAAWYLDWRRPGSPS